MTTKTTTFASFLLIFATSCADAPSEIIGLASQAELVSGRTIANPIVRVHEYNAEESANTYITPVSSITNKPISAWDGSYIEMLIADEYVKCVSEVVGLQPKLPNGIVFTHPEMPEEFANDSPMIQIQSLITQGACPRESYPINGTSKEVVYPEPPLEWAYRRTDPACNRQNLDDVPRAAIELPETDTSNNAPIANFLANVLKIRDFSWISGYNTTLPRAFEYLYRTNVGLCFGTRLNQMLEESETFTTTTQEHLMLLGLAHEQAESSMMRFGQILKLSARSIEETPTSNTSTFAEGAVLRRWLELVPEQVDVARKKFLTALRLTNVTSTALATYLERQAGARWTTVSGADAFSRDWGPGSARSRLLNLVYGGGVLTDLWGDNSSLPFSTKWFSEISSASEDPQVNVLLNLARRNDALFIRSVPGTSPPKLDASSAEALYLETELGLRANECKNIDPTQCTKKALISSLPSSESFSEFLLYRTYRVTLEHARSLVGALFEIAVRHDLLTGGTRTHGSFHLSGTHESKAPSVYGASINGWIKLDPNTTFTPYAYADRAQFGESILSPFTPNWDSFGASERSKHWGYSSQTGTVGVVPALAFAREVLFQETQRGRVSDSNIGTEITASLGELERLIGKRSVIVRTNSIDVIEPASNPVAQLVSPVVAAFEPGLRIAAVDRKFAGPNGVSRSNLDTNATGVDPKRQTTVGTLRLSSWDYSNVTKDTSNLLRFGAGSDTSYLFLGINYSNVIQYDRSATIIEDGWFAKLIQRVTEVQEVNWSRPRWDGFGMSMRWVPPADASLMGGNAGEESYQYLLRSAKMAADEATASVKTAIDNITAEAQDAVALQQAESKASAIAALETSALCGIYNGCQLEETWINFQNTDVATICAEVASLVNIPANLSAVASSAALEVGRKTCEKTVANYNTYLLASFIPELVKPWVNQKTPMDFSGYKGLVGTELQQVLVRILNAAQILMQAKEQAQRLSVAVGVEAGSAAAGATLAEATFEAANAQIDLAAKNAANQNATELANIQAQVDAAKYDAKVDAEWKVSIYCAPKNNGETVYNCLEGACYGKQWGDHDTNTAAWARCQDAIFNLSGANSRYNITMQTTGVAYANLIDSSTTGATSLQTAALVATRNEASAKVAAARIQTASQLAEGQVQSGAHLGVIQQAVNELKASLAALDFLRAKAGQVSCRADFEKDFAQWVANSNASLRRKYRSYDMWRARALLESARRLAVAARRSVEARFVVDLSTLTADQAFVASPSTWADEIYESDLNAPEVVGLSQAPKLDGAIYPNKLIDYVGNLERFVQGYTITYPTSVSLPDTEVISFNGPEQTNNLTGLSSESQGWRFYCPTIDTWIAHPGTGQYPVTNRLATACNGSAPTLAKLGFGLDPWGSLNGAWTRPVYSDRHNVRWRRLAVNLVGTGIRDCAKSTDSMSCYTNPYIRFNLVHAGPSWQTNYSLDWRSLDIPTAHIEGGKALAAEEWLEPITNSWNTAYVSNVARGELFGRPAAGSYELVFEITPDVRLDRIERVQLLVEQDYWVRQNGGQGVYGNNQNANNGSGGATGAGGASSTSGSSGSGGTSSTGGTTGTGGTTSATTLTGLCAPVGNDPLIDNFEDGNKLIGAFEQRLGYWFGFHAGSTCSATPPTDTTFVPSTPNPSNGSIYAGRTLGTGCTSSAGDWSGGGLGFAFAYSYSNGTSNICANGYNASKYTGIAFDARGSGTLRFEVASILNTNENFFGYDFTVGSSWARYTIRWSQLTQNTSWPVGIISGPLNPALFWKFQWLSKSATYDFSLDNVSFISN